MATKLLAEQRSEEAYNPESISGMEIVKNRLVELSKISKEILSELEDKLEPVIKESYNNRHPVDSAIKTQYTDEERGPIFSHYLSIIQEVENVLYEINEIITNIDV